VSLTGNTVVGPTCVKWYQSEVRQLPLRLREVVSSTTAKFDKHLHQQNITLFPHFTNIMADPNLLAILDRMQQNQAETMQILTNLVARLTPVNNPQNQ
jgi:molecular chaperone GrpE (heat shock protein)